MLPAGFMSDLSLRIVDSNASPLLQAARDLFVEYQQSTGTDLCFQGFATELAGLPGEYATPFGRLYVGYVEAQPACCIALRRQDPQSGEMKRLFVRPAFRVRGFGLVLARTVINDAVAIGYRRIVLDTLPTMIDAQRMYERLGFSDIPAYTHNPVGGTRFMGLTLPPDRER